MIRRTWWRIRSAHRTFIDAMLATVAALWPLSYKEDSKFFANLVSPDGTAAKLHLKWRDESDRDAARDEFAAAKREPAAPVAGDDAVAIVHMSLEEFHRRFGEQV